MELNARDFEVTTGLPVGSTSIKYTKNADYAISLKPDFGYKFELVVHCFFFCSVTIKDCLNHITSREFSISRGKHKRQFKWMYFEELQDDSNVLQKNSDIIKSIHALYGTSLIPIENSLSKQVIHRE